MSDHRATHAHALAYTATAEAKAGEEVVSQAVRLQQAVANVTASSGGVRDRYLTLGEDGRAFFGVGWGVRTCSLAEQS